MLFRSEAPKSDSGNFIFRSKIGEFHRRFVAISSGALGVLILLIALARNFISEFPASKLVIPYVMGVFCLYIAFRERQRKHFLWHGYAISFGIMFVIINAGLQNGGFRAPAVAGVILLPMFCISALGERGRWLGILGSLGCLGTIFILEFLHLTADFQEGSSRYIPIIYLGTAAISFLMSTSYEKARIESENEILKMNEQFVSTAKLSALGQMASGIAHEINNPLAVIQGKAQQIQYRINQEAFTLEQTKRDAHKIEKTVDRIAKIVQGLRTFSRNAEQDPIQPTRLDIIVSETFELCSERFKNHQINLIVQCPEELSADCRASQISQVLMNLLLNSFDAVESLQDRWVKLVVEQNEAEIQISVTDSGSGIREDVRRRMMEPFFTTKPVGKGTGLGLSICRGIIEGHGGRFEYDSRCKNTRFTIIIPQSLVVQKNKKNIA